MPGMRTSVTMQHLPGSFTSSRKALADSYRRTFRPADTSRKERAFRTPTSSSTTYTIGVFDTGHVLLVDSSQSKMKGGAFTGNRLGPDLAAMGFHDRPADRESHAH